MTPTLKDLAKVGAQARLNEIREEQQALLKMFPELRGAGGGRKATASSDGASPAPIHKRSRMSAAARKAVGERMKAYWATRRAEKANGAGEGAQAENAGQNGSTSRKSAKKAGRRQGRKK